MQSDGNCNEQSLLGACHSREADPDARPEMTYRTQQGAGMSGDCALWVCLQQQAACWSRERTNPSPKECTVMINTNMIAFLAGAPESFPSRTSPCRLS